MPDMRTVVMLSLAVLVTSAGGCMSTRVLRVAQFAPGGETARVEHLAPTSAAYHVKYADATGKGLQNVGGTKRIVARGERLGFVAADDGRIFAIAGEEQIALDRLPVSARYCVWTTSDKRPAQFNREVAKAVITGVTVTAVAVAVVTLIVVEIYLNSHDDNERSKSGRRDRHHQRRERPPDRGGRRAAAQSQPPSQK